MKIVKIGDRYINLSHVYQIKFLDHELSPELAALLDIAVPISMYQAGPEDSTAPIEAVEIALYGKEAEALRYYLNGQAVDIEQEYAEHLERLERTRYRTEWYAKFDAFIQDTQLDQDTAYEYQLWLTDGHDYPNEKQPDEETFAKWVKLMEEAIDEKLDFAGIMAGPEREEFKAYCLTHAAYRPTWNSFKIWRSDKKTGS